MIVKARNRREFLAEVGRGMFAASLGGVCAGELGLAPLLLQDGSSGGERLSFGARDRLVALVAETPVDRLLPTLVSALRAGTGLQDLVAAAALANARAFGGEDYVGFHTFMALAPAWRMAQDLPAKRCALPVLKVLHRNSVRLAAWGGAERDVLRPVERASLSAEQSATEVVRDAVHRRDLATAEGAFATAAADSIDGAWNGLLGTVHESLDVHRVVLAHRAWDMLTLAGVEHGHTLLRQSLHYCIKSESYAAPHSVGIRALLPKLLEQHGLLGMQGGVKAVDDSWVDSMCETLLRATDEQAADAVAAALAEGIAPQAVGEAIALAANQLMLRDGGRTARQVQPGKPLGSVHGDSIGIHASDSAHAWRHIAEVSDTHNRLASLILAGYQVARDRVERGGSFGEWTPRPAAEELAKVVADDPLDLLTALDGAIRSNDQDGACAAAQRYHDLGHPARAAFDLLLEHATLADGALHAEKYYWTTSSEFVAARPAFRSRHLVALARVCASQFGTPAPGVAEARELLGA